MTAPIPVPAALKPLRCTKYLPQFRGLSLLLRCYRAAFPAGAVATIDDFDGDLSIDVNICETMGINLWHAPRLYERQERALFCAALAPGCTVLDVGANIGVYSLLAAKRGARVVAIEADPINAAALRQNLKRNELADRVEIREMAATDRPTSITLHRHPFNTGGSSLYGTGEPVMVEGRTIDSLKLSSVDVCKMDIEGAEIEALRGMSETIQRSPRLKLLVECSRDRSEVVRFLRERFRHITIVGHGELGTDEPQAFCNLWASN